MLSNSLSLIWPPPPYLPWPQSLPLFKAICLFAPLLRYLPSSTFVWQETYTEIAGMHRFGAFYMDYLYTMEDSSGKGIVLVHSLLQSLFGHLATSSLFFFLSVMFPFSLPGSPFLSFFLSLFRSFHLFSSLLPVKQAPWRLEERACLVSVTATWSLTLSVLTLTLNLPGGQLSEVFSLCWHIFEFLSPWCLLKHCFPSVSLPVSSWESE